MPDQERGEVACARCGHGGLAHGETSSTLLSYVSESWPNCTVEGCECEAFTFMTTDNTQTEGERREWRLHHTNWTDSDGVLSPEGAWYNFDSPDDHVLLVNRLNNLELLLKAERDGQAAALESAASRGDRAVEALIGMSTYGRKEDKSLCWCDPRNDDGSHASWCDAARAVLADFEREKGGG